MITKRKSLKNVMNGLNQSGDVSKTLRRFSSISERIANGPRTDSNIPGRVQNKLGIISNKPGHVSNTEEESRILQEVSHICQEVSQIYQEESCMSERLSNKLWSLGGTSTSSGRVSNKTYLKHDRKYSQKRRRI